VLHVSTLLGHPQAKHLLEVTSIALLHLFPTTTNAIKWIYFSEYIIGDIWETLADPVNWM
jgi:hypothetical protein